MPDGHSLNILSVHGSLGLPGWRLFRGFTLLSPFFPLVPVPNRPSRLRGRQAAKTHTLPSLPTLSTADRWSQIHPSMPVCLPAQHRQANLFSAKFLPFVHPQQLHKFKVKAQRSVHCCFTSTETVRIIRDVHLDFHTAFYFGCYSVRVQCFFTSTETVRIIRDSPGRPPRLSHSS